MRRWIDLISRHAGSLSMRFTLVFYRWLHMYFIMVDDYPYIGVDFHRDLELALLEGEQWGAIGRIF